MKNTLAQWLKSHHPDIYVQWAVEKRDRKREYKKNYMREKYYNKKPSN